MITVRSLIPIHLGGIYTYLSGSLVIGAVVLTAFVTLTLITRK